MDFRQVEPRGDGGEVEEKLLFFKFINNKSCISLVVELGLESESGSREDSKSIRPYL